MEEEIPIALYMYMFFSVAVHVIVEVEMFVANPESLIFQFYDDTKILAFSAGVWFNIFPAKLFHFPVDFRL